MGFPRLVQQAAWWHSPAPRDRGAGLVGRSCGACDDGSGGGGGSIRLVLDEIAAGLGFRITEPVEKLLTPEEEAERAETLESDSVWFQASIKVLSAAKAGEGSGGEVSMNMSGKYRIRCPWGDEHSNGDPYGAYFRERIPGAEYDYVFGCGHDTCRKDWKRTWAAFVDEVAIPSIVKSLERANQKFARCSFEEIKQFKVIK